MILDIVEEYGVEKCIYQNISWDTLLNDRRNFKKINEDHDLISYFTDWSAESFSSVWLGTKRPLDNLEEGAIDELIAKDYTEICP